MQPQQVEYIIVHCSRTTPSPDYGLKDLDRKHRLNGALSCGYHYVIKTDGTRETGRFLHEPGNHCFGFNDKSIGICLVGGVGEDNKPADTFTAKQKESLAWVLNHLKKYYPKAKPVAHKDLIPKAKGCLPCKLKDLLPKLT